MSGLAAEIREGVKEFLDNPANNAQHSLSRATVLTVGKSAIEIAQTKFVEPEEMSQLQADGPQVLTTTDWFNDVEWKQELNDDRGRPNWRELHLDATYPMRFFSKKPDVGVGHYMGKRWHEQYTSIDGFGNRGVINQWLLTYVDLDSRTVVALHHPDDPTALERYNERYREYMRTLDQANPTISYHRGWDRFFRAQKDEPKRIIQGMSLSGLGLNEIVSLGSYAPEENENVTSINLLYENPKGERFGRMIDIADEDEATTEVFWTERRRVRRAGEDILKVTLELVHDAITKSVNNEPA